MGPQESDCSAKDCPGRLRWPFVLRCPMPSRLHGPDFTACLAWPRFSAAAKLLAVRRGVQYRLPKGRTLTPLKRSPDLDVSYRTEFDGSEWTATASIRYGRRHANKPQEVWFRSKEPFSPDADFLVPLTLFPAMQRGEDLVIPAISAIDRSLKANLEQIQTLYERFGPPHGHHVKRINVRASSEKRKADARPKSGALFFSCGIDSFYSVLKHRDDLDALIFIRGFDTRLDKAEAGELQVADVRRAAAELGIRLIEVTTNVRSAFSDAWLHWDIYHGCVMAAVALLLAPHFHRIYISSSFPYEVLYAGGTHPLLDPLWSAKGMELVHTGNEASRWEKLAKISVNEVAQKYLKICWRNYEGNGNCGRCYQCLRAMGVLEFLARRHLFRTFPPDFDPSLLATVGIGLIDTIQNGYDFWEYVKDNPQLAAAARANINASIANLQAHLER